MDSFRLSSAAVAIATLTLLACERHATAPALDPGAMSASAVAPITLSASGSGHVIFVAGTLTGRRTFAFTARQYADGSANGQIQVHNRAANNGVHGQIICMRDLGEGVIGIGARVRTYGNFTTGLFPNFTGDHVVFAVRDNGEGPGAPADEFTGVDLTGVAPNGVNFALLLCTNPAALRVTPALVASQFLRVEDGNIQVRQ